jgi:hypothetical protein
MFKNKAGSQEAALVAASDTISEGKVSINNVTGSESILYLDSLIDVIESCSENVDILNAKEKKLLCNIATSLASEAGALIMEPLMASIIQTCRVKVLSILLQLLAVPFIAKKEYDAIFSRGLIKCLGYEDTKIASMTLCCISSGMFALEDDVLRTSVCLAMDRHEYYAKLGSIIACTADHIADPSPEVRDLYPFMRACEQLNMVLRLTSLPTVTSSPLGQGALMLRGKILDMLQKRLPALIKLVPHEYRPISYDAIVLLINLLNGHNVATCIQIQEWFRYSGSLIKLLHIAVRNIIALEISESTDTSESDTSRGLEADFGRESIGTAENPGWILVQYGKVPTNRPACIDDEEIQYLESEQSTPEQHLDSLKCFVALLCIGNVENMNVIFRALPEGFRASLSSKAEVTRFVLSKIDTGNVNELFFFTDTEASEVVAALTSKPVTPQRKSSIISNIINKDADDSPAQGTVFSNVRTAVTLGRRRSSASSSISANTAFQSRQLLNAAFAEKYGLNYTESSWHVLFEHLPQSFNTTTLKWDGSHMRVLERGLGFACAEYARILQKIGEYQWDLKLLDIYYESYESRDSMYVRGMFLSNLLEELLCSGPESIAAIRDPKDAFMAVLDRALNEMALSPSRLLLCLKVLFFLFTKYKDAPSLRDAIPFNAMVLLLDRGREHCTDSQTDDMITPPGDDARASVGSLAYDFSQTETSSRWIFMVLRILRMVISSTSSHISRTTTAKFIVAGGRESVLGVLSSEEMIAAMVGRDAMDLADHTGKAGNENSIQPCMSTDDYSDDSNDDEIFVSPKGTPEPSPHKRMNTHPSSPKRAKSPKRVILQDIQVKNSPSTGFDDAGSALTNGAGMVLCEAACVLHSLILNSKVTFTTMSSVDGMNELAKVLWQSSPHGPAAPKGYPEVVETVVTTIQHLVNISEPSVCLNSIRHSAILPSLLACSIRKRGKGMMTSSIAKLLGDIVSMDVEDVCNTSGNGATSTTRSSAGNDSEMRRRRNSFVGMSVAGKVVPPQLLCLFLGLRPSTVASIFNASIYSPEIIWNYSLRRTCADNLQINLREVLKGSSTEIYEESEFKTAAYPTLATEPQLSGLYLRPLINAEPKSFLVKVDAAAVCAKLLDVLRHTYAQLVDSTQPSCEKLTNDYLDSRFKAKVLADVKQIDLGATGLDALHEYRRISLVAMCVGRMALGWQLPLELWTDRIAPSILVLLQLMTSRASDSLDSYSASRSTGDSSGFVEVAECLSVLFLTVTKAAGAGYLCEGSGDILEVKSSFADVALASPSPDIRILSVFEMVLKACTPLWSKCLDAIACVDTSEMVRSQCCGLVEIITAFGSLSLVKLFDVISRVEAYNRQLSEPEGAEIVAGQEIAYNVDMATIHNVLSAMKSNHTVDVFISCCSFKYSDSTPNTVLAALGCLQMLVAQRIILCDQAAADATSDLRSTFRVDVTIHDMYASDFLTNLLWTILSAQSESPTGISDGDTYSRWATHQYNSVEAFAHVSHFHTSKLSADETVSMNGKKAISEKKMDEACNVIIDGHEVMLKKDMFTVPENGKCSKTMVSTEREQENDSLKQLQPASVTDMATSVCDTTQTIIREYAELLRLMILCEACFAVDPKTKERQYNTRQTINLNAVKSSMYTRPLGPVLEYLLTPSLVYLLISDVPLFLRILFTPKLVERGLAVWQPTMRQAAIEALSDGVFANGKSAEDKASSYSQENSTTTSNTATPLQSPRPQSPRQQGGTNGIEFTSRKPLHAILNSECIVEGVYIKYLLTTACRDDIGARDIARFVEDMQSSISTSKLLLEHLAGKQAKAPNNRQAKGIAKLQGQLTLKDQVLTLLMTEHPELGYSDLCVNDEREDITMY